MKKEVVRVEMDLKKIFLTPPNTRREQITLLVMMVVLFIMFFGPICFTEIHPVKAILLSCLPALSVSWGWIVLLRSLFRKSEFCRLSCMRIRRLFAGAGIVRPCTVFFKINQHKMCGLSWKNQAGRLL